MQSAHEKYSLAKDRLKETNSFQKLKGKTIDVVNENEKVQKGLDTLKQRK